MDEDVTSFALEALAHGGGPSAAKVTDSLINAIAADDVPSQQRTLVALAAVCASPAARDAVEAGAVEAAVDAIDAAPAHALRCLADCVRACPAAATKATRPRVLHAVLRAAQQCAADIRVAYAATTLVAAVVAEEHVACYSVPLVVEEGALVLLHDALNCARQVCDYPLAIAALRAAGDIAAHAHYVDGGATSIRTQMLEIGLISAATDVFSEMFSSVLIRDAALSFIAATCSDSPQCATHFGELNGGDGVRLVLSAARRPVQTNLSAENANSSSPTADLAHQVRPVTRDHSNELFRKTAESLAQITIVERNCGVIRSLRGISTIVALVAQVAHSARHVEAALTSLERCVSTSQSAARDAFHAEAAKAIVVAMQRHRHRASVQACAIRCLITLTELYDCHRQAACRASAVQSVYFALTEHGRSAEIVTSACKFMLLLSPCDIISNQICVADLLRVVSMRRNGNSSSSQVQVMASNLIEAIEFIPGDILRKVEVQFVHSASPSRSSSGISTPTSSGSGSLSGTLASGSNLSPRRNLRNWKRRTPTVSTLRSSGRTPGKNVHASRLSFPALGRTEVEAQAELREKQRLTGRSSNSGTLDVPSGELHYQLEDVLAGVEKGPEGFLLRQTLGRTLESARQPETEYEDGLSLDEAGLEETLASRVRLLPGLSGPGASPSGILAQSPRVGSTASSEPASPPWNQWPVGPLGNEASENDYGLGALQSLPQGALGGSTDGIAIPMHIPLFGGSQHSSSPSRGETGCL